MRIRYLKRATDDLIAIADYVREKSPLGAISIEKNIRSSVARLATFPGSGHATDDPSIRILTVGRYPYLVFYEVRLDAVVIHHIRDARRKPIDPDDAHSE